LNVPPKKNPMKNVRGQYTAKELSTTINEIMIPVTIKIKRTFLNFKIALNKLDLPSSRVWLVS